MSSVDLIHLLDATLPQTQCGLCGHPAGCLPYATAMAQGERSNACVPGGQPVADQLAAILQRPVISVNASQWPIMADGRPQRMKAVIREEECIGCTKCISACPVDAIMGSGKVMHTILTTLCTGCELCIAPCPVDCIDLIPDHADLPHPDERVAEQNDLRQRYQAHILRDQQRLNTKKAKKPVVAASMSLEQASAITGVNLNTINSPHEPVTTSSSASQMIKLASLRSQIKKLERQLHVNPHDMHKLQQLDLLKAELQQYMDK